MAKAAEDRDQDRHDEVAEAILQEADIGDISAFKGKKEKKEKEKIAFPMHRMANFLLGGRNYERNRMTLVSESSAKNGSSLVRVRGKENIWINFYQLKSGGFAVRLGKVTKGPSGIGIKLEAPNLKFYAREILRLGFERAETRQRKFRTINIDTDSFHAVIRDDGFIDVTPKH